MIKFSLCFYTEVAKAKTPVLWPPHVKSWLTGKDFDAGRDWGQEEKGTTEDAMAGWHHWLHGRESEWTLGDGDGQGGLAAAIHGVAKSRTRLSDWTELNWVYTTEITETNTWKMSVKKLPFHFLLFLESVRLISSVYPSECPSLPKTCTLFPFL